MTKIQAQRKGSDAPLSSEEKDPSTKVPRVVLPQKQRASVGASRAVHRLQGGVLLASDKMCFRTLLPKATSTDPNIFDFYCCMKLFLMMHFWRMMH